MVINSRKQWISMYLFYKHDLTLLLVKLVHPLINQWTQRKIISNYFYIRYWEDGQHIRLRIKTYSELSEKKIKYTILQFYEQNLLNTKHYDDEFKVVFQTYEPEINRYGGKEAIKLAELFFEYHSKICLQVLSEYWYKWNYNLALSIDMQMLIIFLKFTGNEIKDCILFFDFLFSMSSGLSIKDTKMQDYEKEITKQVILFDNLYSGQKCTIDYICEKIWHQTDWGKTDWRYLWAQNCKEVIVGFQKLKSKGSINISNAIDGHKILEEIHMMEKIEWLVWQSYFHMTNNRMGLFPPDESFIYFALLKGFENLKNYK